MVIKKKEDHAEIDKKEVGNKKMSSTEITLKRFHCERCSHDWIPRTHIDSTPVVCPKCHSAYWNIPKEQKNE